MVGRDIDRCRSALAARLTLLARVRAPAPSAHTRPAAAATRAGWSSPSVGLYSSPAVHPHHTSMGQHSLVREVRHGDVLRVGGVRLGMGRGGDVDGVVGLREETTAIVEAGGGRGCGRGLLYWPRAPAMPPLAEFVQGCAHAPLTPRWKEKSCAMPSYTSSLRMACST